jgi:hypothetical protein
VGRGYIYRYPLIESECLRTELYRAATAGNLPKGIPTDGNFIAILSQKDDAERREK